MPTLFCVNTAALSSEASARAPLTPQPPEAESGDAPRTLATYPLDPVEADWPFLLSLLPTGWEQWARETHAFQRRRGVPDVATLLRLVFAYGYCGLSLRLTVFWADLQGLAELSEVALLKRLQRARPWLAQLLSAKLQERTGRRRGSVPPTEIRVRLVDATSVSRPGSTGTDWRLHLGFDLWTQQIQQIEVTPATGGETLKRLPSQPGEITVADRGYAQRQGIAALVAGGGWVLVRLNSSTVPLETVEDAAFDWLAALRTLADGQVGEWSVQTAPADDGTPAVPGRLVAVRKSPEAAEAARRRVRKEARRKGKTPTARSLEAAAYLFLFTTVPPELLSAAELLELYRFRWQIELAFKRMKSLLELDELPAKDPDLGQTVLLTKLLAALLVDELTHRWVDFSPWGYGYPAAPVAVAGVSRGSGHFAAVGGGDGESRRLATRACGDARSAGHAPAATVAGDPHPASESIPTA